MLLHLNIPDSIEVCYHIGSISKDKPARLPQNYHRIYFGHETCEKLLPNNKDLPYFLEFASKKELKLTLVTPFLTNRGIDKVHQLADILNSYFSSYEIVISDWGLLHALQSRKTVEPVISRFLTGQQTDFRLQRIGTDSDPSVIFWNDKYYHLQSRKPGREMTEHLSSCSLLKQNTVELLASMGVTRFELNNIHQNIQLPDFSCKYSLHIPFVPLTQFRHCPESTDFNKINKHCDSGNCRQHNMKWTLPDDEVYCFRNALFYYNPNYENQLKINPLIDRLVIDQYFFD